MEQWRKFCYTDPMTSNPFDRPELTEEQSQRLREAVEMIAGGDPKLAQTIEEESLKTLQQLLEESDGSPEAVEAAVDRTEEAMTDVAFGNGEEIVDTPEEDLAALLAKDNSDDEFMGGGNFESLDALEEKEFGEDTFDYEHFQDEWN